MKLNIEVRENILSFDIYVEPAERGQSVGSQALAALCAYADTAKLAIHIFAEPDDPEDLEALIGWYEKYGFTKVGPGTEYRQRMERTRQ